MQQFATAVSLIVIVAGLIGGFVLIIYLDFENDALKAKNAREAQSRQAKIKHLKEENQIVGLEQSIAAKK